MLLSQKGEGSELLLLQVLLNKSFTECNLADATKSLLSTWYYTGLQTIRTKERVSISQVTQL